MGFIFRRRKLRKLIALCSIFTVSNVHASSGYTWLSTLENHYGLPLHISTFFLVALIITVLGASYKFVTVGKAEAELIIPDKGISLKNVLETFGEGIYGLCVQVMGEDRASQYFSFSCFLFLFIFLSNVIGLIPGFTSPTDNLNTTLALGVFSFIYYNVKGVQAQGLWGHIKHFMGPIWWLAPFMFLLEIVSHCIRPLSLALRLNGNIVGDHAVLGVFSELVPYLVPIPFMVLGLFVCFMQAFVFTVLSIVYVALSTEVHDHDHH